MTPRMSANGAPSGPAGGAQDLSDSTQVDYLSPFWTRFAVVSAIAFNLGCAYWIFILVGHLCGGHDSCWHTLVSEPLPAEGAKTISVTPIYSGTRFPVWVMSLREEASTGVFLWKGMVLAVAVTALTGIEFLIFRVRGDARHRSEQAADTKQGDTPKPDEQNKSRLGRMLSSAIPSLREWFEAKGKPFLVCLSFLPAALFFAAMILDGEQDAAVFAMALAAIFVAAEHYSSLERQKGIAGEQGRDLRSQLTYLDQLNDQLRGNVRSIVSALGKSPAQEEIYRLYSLLPADKKKDDGKVGKVKHGKELAVESDSAAEVAPAVAPAVTPDPAATDQPAASQDQAEEEEEPELTQSDRHIYAIFRECFVDAFWWSEETGKGQWDTFLSVKPASGHMTLAYALMTGQRRRVTVVVPYRFRRQTGDGISFKDFIGLMWHCVMFEKLAERIRAEDARRQDVRSDADKAIQLRIAMADTALWLHVVDRDVHQIVDQPEEEIMVRNLSLNIAERAIPLAQWAKREIDQLASYGPGAEEFLCVALCNAYPNIFKDNELEVGIARAILRSSSLEMEAWLKKERPEVRENRENGCIRLLMDFAEMLYLRQNGKKPSAASGMSTRVFCRELE